MSKQSPKPVPDAHTIVRKIAKTKLVRDKKTGELRPIPQAFELRPKEDYLSASWLEHSGASRPVCVEETVKVLRAVTNIPVGNACGFALGNVGVIKGTCLEFEKKIRVLNEWTSTNPAYTAVRLIGPNNLDLMEKLAATAWCEIVENVTVPDNR